MCRSLLVVSLLFLVGCSSAPNFWDDAKPGQKRVLVSFAPIYCITHAIAGDDAYVLCLLASQGPHGYDGAATDLLKVESAQLVIYNGLGLDDIFISKMMRASGRRAKELNIGEEIEETEDGLLKADKGHLHADGKIHIHGKHDPHVWLGPKQAMAMTRIIRDKLIKLDPDHQAGYEARAEAFIIELKKLQEHGDNAFKEKTNRKLVTMHESFTYFKDAFSLDVVSPIQAKPGNDPDAKSLANLVELCIKEDVKVIAVEPQYPKALAETLRASLKQRNADIHIIEMDPLETAPIPPGGRFNPDPAYYLTKMRENIDTLAKALP